MKDIAKRLAKEFATKNLSSRPEIFTFWDSTKGQEIIIEIRPGSGRKQLSEDVEISAGGPGARCACCNGTGRG
jgi:hypothetical protein